MMRVYALKKILQVNSYEQREIEQISIYSIIGSKMTLKQALHVTNLEKKKKFESENELLNA